MENSINDCEERNLVNHFGTKKRLTRGMLRKLKDMKLNKQSTTDLINIESLYSEGVYLLNNTIERAILPEEDTSRDDTSIIECSELFLPLEILQEKKNNTIKQAMVIDKETSSRNDQEPTLQKILQENNTIEQSVVIDENKTNSRDDDQDASIIECSMSFLSPQQISPKKKNGITEETSSRNEQDASIIECSEPILSLPQQISQEKNNIEQAVIKDKINSRNDDQDASVIECSKSEQKPFLPIQKDIAHSTSQEVKSKSFHKKKKQKKKSLVILIDNDSPDGHLADVQKPPVNESIQSSSNGENIAPQMEDDIIELWSNLKPKKRKRDKLKKCENRKYAKICFVDTKPDLKNLYCLNTERPNKKRKLHDKTDKVAKRHNGIFVNATSTTAEKYNKDKKKKNKKCGTSTLTSDTNSNSTSTSDANSTSTSNVNSNSDSISKSDRLRKIIVDGSNVARAYTHNQEFAEMGIQLVVDYFMTRGHDVKVFLPQYFRQKKYRFLEKMYREGVVIFTPSRRVLGRQITPYDDRYILEYATLCDGIVVSGDQYRDLYEERPDWRDTIANRILTPTFVEDCVMFPDDPLGRFGPNLRTFLRH